MIDLLGEYGRPAGYCRVLMRWRSMFINQICKKRVFQQPVHPVSFVHRGSLSQKIKRGEMTKIFVAFNSVPEGSIFLNPYLI